MDAGKHALGVDYPPRNQSDVDVPTRRLEGVRLELAERRRQSDARDFRDR